MPTKRQVVREALEFRRPAYVPWSFGFTVEARKKLVEHFGTDDLSDALENHLLRLAEPAVAAAVTATPRLAREMPVHSTGRTRCQRARIPPSKMMNASATLPSAKVSG